MILVDSSVWIDYFNGVDAPQTEKLDKVLGINPVAIGDLILAEVLKGFRQDSHFHLAKKLFQSLDVYQLLNPIRAVDCAENFRTLRKQGITIRKTADTIIATYCISEHLPLLYSDKDFDPFVKYLGLVSVM